LGRCELELSAFKSVFIKRIIMKSLTINLPEDTNLKDAKMIVAAALFKQGILSSGQAAEMIGISRRKFLEDVGKYGVSIFGETEEDLEKVKTLAI
jgi:predicted HTH domain antitoxin